MDSETGADMKFFRPPNVVECMRCPDLAWLFILAYVVAAFLCAGLLLWLTQKREINFAGMRIAIDYYQVLSMFAGLKVAWPAEVNAAMHDGVRFLLSTWTGTTSRFPVSVRCT